MATPDQIDLASEEFDRLIEVAHKQGLNYWEILGELIKKAEILYIQAECEYRMKIR